ncbi:hypothetical protein ACN4EK_15995 [Pantanalinema rosaneae CENA516]|uniref:hypothetical protein n=1 Tax=Pantanalinema rosaneae TaxID=1620701 RepID=UPI003D6DCFB2
MSKFDDTGELMHLPLEKIISDEPTYESEFIVNAAAEAILNSDGRNWMPIIVEKSGDHQYRVVSNHFVYAVAQQAELERVWCIIIESNPQLIQQAKILAKETLPKVNLNTASRDSIVAALRYLEAEPGSALKGLDVTVAANRIEDADRESWSDFNPITKLKCGITKGKKLDALDKVFFLSAVQIPPAPETISIKQASRDEIFERLNYLSTYKIGGFDKLDPDKTADTIFTTNKGKWKSLNPITKLECGIDTTKIKVLKTVFSL